MKAVAFIAIIVLSGCVSPTFTIYRQGAVKTTSKTQDGTKTVNKAIAVKALQFYSDLDGDVEISGAGFNIRATGGINNSRLAKVNWDGATGMARATIQPIVFGSLGAGAVGAAAGAAKILVKP